MTKQLRELIADGIAALFVLSLPGFIGLTIVGLFGATLMPINATWFGLYAFVTLMSATKLYGKSVYNAVKGVASGFLSQNRGNN